jgi:PAS domain S-box-containing protein/diguanylate cyclase (GGDEF)-like protein
VVNISQTDIPLADIVFSRAAEGMAITDAKGLVLDVNDAFVRFTGYSREDVMGHSLRLLKSDRHEPEFYAAMWQSLVESGRWQGEIWNCRKNGEVYPEWLSISSVRDAEGRTTHFVGVFTDIKELVGTQEKLRQLAHHDSLTGLPNRHLLEDRYGQAMSRALRFRYQMALLIIGLDPAIASKPGVGKRVAQELAAHLRESDTLAHISDNEFALMLDHIEGPREVSVIADKLLGSFKLPLAVGADKVLVSACIGISLFPIDGHEIDGLIRDARVARAEAELQGRNTYSFFSSQMNAYAGERLLLAWHLRRALELDELSLKYQPQYDAETGKLVGVEALLRWSNLALGMVGPDRFVPVAEDHGYIHTIGEWVLRVACRQFTEWQRMGCAPKMLAVNISAKQIAAPGFVEMVESVLDDSGMSGDCLELDLTESVLSSVHFVKQTIEGLRGLGVHIAIDDFGTGVTSLGNLNSMPIRKLKIDQGFIRGIGRDPAQEKIVRAVISLAKTFGLRVIAEGVETEQQAKFLRAEGCHEFQGYLLGRAVSAQDYCGTFCPVGQGATGACPVAARIQLQG